MRVETKTMFLLIGLQKLLIFLVYSFTKGELNSQRTSQSRAILLQRAMKVKFSLYLFYMLSEY